MSAWAPKTFLPKSLIVLWFFKTGAPFPELEAPLITTLEDEED